MLLLLRFCFIFCFVFWLNALKFIASVPLVSRVLRKLILTIFASFSPWLLWRDNFGVVSPYSAFFIDISILTVLSTSQIFCKGYFKWNLPDFFFFLMIRLELWFLERNITVVKCDVLLDQVKGTYYKGTWVTQLSIRIQLRS